MFPVLVQLGGLKIYTYGVCLGLSCVLGGHIAVYLSARSGIRERQAWWFALSVILIGIVGGRVHDVAVNAPDLATFFREMTKLEHAGRTAYGAFVSATLAAIVVGRVLGVSFWRFGDAAAPTMALGLGLTRIGCFGWGCDYGCRVDPPWGVSFPPHSPAWGDQVQAGLLAPTAPGSLPVLPMQLIESAAGFLIGAILVRTWFRRPRREGSNLLLFFVLYGLVRALLEQWRADSGRGELLGLSTSTTIGLGTALAGLVLLLVPPLAALRPEAGPVLPPPGQPGAVDDPNAAAAAPPSAAPPAKGAA